MHITVFDIIVLIPLAWALYRGFKDGIVVQLGGLAGLLVGIYLAFRFGSLVGRWVGGWFDADQSVSGIVGFIVVLVVVIILVALLSRLLSKLFCAAGLSALVKVSGAVVSVLKMGLILGILLYCFDWLNDRQYWVPQEKLDRTALYRPLVAVAEFTFPYIDFVKDKIVDSVTAE